MYIRHRRKAAALVMTLLLAAGTAALSGCGRSYEYITGDVEWYSTYKADDSAPGMSTVKDSFYYSDDWFRDDPARENRELALASMQLAASCVKDDPDGCGAEFLRSMGFEETGFSGFGSSDPDDCSYTWGRKDTGDGTIIAIAIQSSSDDQKAKNKAWKQNFTVNDPAVQEPSGEHYAYGKAADKVIDDIASLAEGGAAVWITGQSRGGAIANVLAARLPEKLGDAKVFAYTFESPATVDADSVSGDCKYIHNYVCSDDIVTLIPVWGMTRYGVMHDLKTDETDEGLDDALTALGSDAAGMKARIVTGDAASALARNFEDKVPSRAEYSKERTDKWTDEEGIAHEVTYSYQEALVKLMDLVFREDSKASLLNGLSAHQSELSGTIDLLKEGVKKENSGADPAADYWAATEGMYAVMSKITDGDLPVTEEDLYKVLSFAAPVLISVPEDGGEPDTELLTDVIGYSRELTYSHTNDTLIARLKILAPAPEQ